MQEYIVELAGYGILFCVALFTVSSLIGVLFDEENHPWLNLFCSLLIAATQVILFLDLAIVYQSIEYLFLLAFMLILLFVLVGMTPLLYEDCSRMLLNLCGMMISLGIGMISRLSTDKSFKQYMIILCSLMLSFLIPFFILKWRGFRKLTWLYCAAGILLLAGVLFAGKVVNGSKLNFSFAEGVSIQPSEFVKLLFLFFLASFLSRNSGFRSVAVSAVFAGLHVIILVLSKDLGSALIFFAGYVFLVFAATGNPLYLLAGGAGGTAAAYVAFRLFRHVQIRYFAWRDPWKYIEREGWAITQSMFAFGSGSWFGMGLGKGNPKSIPFVEQDFIFTCICEELGVCVGICLILMTLMVFLIACKMAYRMKDKYFQLLAFGIGCMYIFQVFLTVGGGITLIPLTGVTLPFVSYGGSSSTVTMFMIFVLQAIEMRCAAERRTVHEGNEKER
ncbi:MAG: FtsW/RodA/SpoVE family cell cycle protein [Acetatifactor sp.]|nr:FtsW/RodA/SpoVE family cell cycle protein [Acetatifactor sp.]